MSEKKVEQPFCLKVGGLKVGDIYRENINK